MVYYMQQLRIDQSARKLADLATIIVCHMQQLRISQHENCYGLSYNYGLSHATVANESGRPKLLWTPSASWSCDNYCIVKTFLV